MRATVLGACLTHVHRFHFCCVCLPLSLSLPSSVSPHSFGDKSLSSHPCPVGPWSFMFLFFNFPMCALVSDKLRYESLLQLSRDRASCLPVHTLGQLAFQLLSLPKAHMSHTWLSGDLNLVPHSCIAITLPTEVSPWSLVPRCLPVPISPQYWDHRPGSVRISGDSNPCPHAYTASSLSWPSWPRLCLLLIPECQAGPPWILEDKE